MTEYRLIQNGRTVAGVDGPDDQARREIKHYAAVYSQDGPVHIQKRESDGWHTLVNTQL